MMVCIPSTCVLSAPELLGDLGESVGRGLLRLVRVFRSGVDLEFPQLCSTERVLRKHPADGLLNRTDRVLLQQFSIANSLQTPRVPGLTIRLLLRELLTGKSYPVGIDDNNEVAGVDVVRKDRLVLAAQQRGSVAGESTEHNIGGVNNNPVPLDIRRLGREGARHRTATF